MKFRKAIMVGVLAVAAGAMNGCAIAPAPALCTGQLSEVGYSLADHLVKGLGEHDMDSVIVVGSIANLDNMDEVSPLGRLVGEQIGTRLAQIGVKVAEPRLRSVLSMTKSGEHVLSREAKDLAAKTKAFAFVTGTVTRMQGRYYFNARLVRAKDAQVLSAYDVCLSGKIKEAGL